jgi:hypothetical protein
VMFPHKKKMMTLQDTTMRSKSIIPSSEDFKDISKVILQEKKVNIKDAKRI